MELAESQISPGVSLFASEVRVGFTTDFLSSLSAVREKSGFRSSMDIICRDLDLRHCATITREDLDRYKLSLHVQNLFDKRFQILGDTAGNLLQYQIDNIGRVFGITASAKF